MNDIVKQLELEPSYRLSRIITVFVVLLFFGWSISAIQLDEVESNGWTVAKNILLGLVQPDTELLFNVTNGVPYLLLETIAIAFLGTIVGAILAIPLAFLSASNIVQKPIAWLVRLLLIFIRTIPAIVYGLMFIRVTGPGAFAGVLTEQ